MYLLYIEFFILLKILIFAFNSQWQMEFIYEHYFLDIKLSKNFVT